MHRVLRRISGTKWDGVAGGWREIRNEGIHEILLGSMWWTGHVARTDKMGKIVQDFNW